jgi:hypothetical protein
MQAVKGLSIAHEDMRVQVFHQGFTPLKIVNTNVDDENVLFDNYSYSVRIFCAAICRIRGE